MINPGFPTHTRIDLRQQGGRYLDKIYSALEAGRGKSGHIPNDATTYCQYSTIAVKPGFKQSIKNQVQMLAILIFFTIRQNTGRNTFVQSFNCSLITLQ